MTTLKIGNTPLIELTKEIRVPNGARIFAKLERENDGGSIKSRVALALIEDGEKRGLLKQGGAVVEATSGNTGIGLALVAKAKGYKALIFMPQNSAEHAVAGVQGYGGEVAFTPDEEGMLGAVKRAAAFAERQENCYYANQFHNPVCALVHTQTTGREIWVQMQGKADIFVAGIGTGGTLTGVSRWLKEKNPALQTVGVEPAASPLLSKGWAGAHRIQGIGANFIPPILDKPLIDEMLTATEEEALFWVNRLQAEVGIAVGLSSGAALAACMCLAERKQNAGKNIVTIFPDGGARN